MPDADTPQVELAEGEFVYFGEKFVYAEEFPAFEWAEFHAARLDGDELSEADAQGYLIRLAVACVAEKDQARFRRVSRRNKAKLADWSKLIGEFTAAEAERPTGLPSDSSPGPQPDRSSSATPSGSGSAPKQPVASVASLPAAKAKRAPRGDMGLCVARAEGLASEA